MVSSFSVMCILSWTLPAPTGAYANELGSYLSETQRECISQKSLAWEGAEPFFLFCLVSLSAHTSRFYIYIQYSIYIYFPAALCVGFAMELWCYNSDSCFRTRICYYYSQQECPATILLLMRRAMQKCEICITLWHVSSPAPCKTMRMENFGADCRGSQNIISPRCACARVFDLACAHIFLHSFA
jgi:hypothetical protein